jgi:hypothetical protein
VINPIVVVRENQHSKYERGKRDGKNVVEFRLNGKKYFRRPLRPLRLKRTAKDAKKVSAGFSIHCISK